MKVKRDDLEHLINDLTATYCSIKTDPVLKSHITGSTINCILETTDFLEKMWQEFNHKALAAGPNMEVEAISFGDGTTEYSFKSQES